MGFGNPLDPFLKADSRLVRVPASIAKDNFGGYLHELGVRATHEIDGNIQNPDNQVGKAALTAALIFGAYSAAGSVGGAAAGGEATALGEAGGYGAATGEGASATAGTTSLGEAGGYGAATGETASTTAGTTTTSTKTGITLKDAAAYASAAQAVAGAAQAAAKPKPQGLAAPPQGSKAPDASSILAGVSAQGQGGGSAGVAQTFLTGPGGIDPALLKLGKTTLLGG